MANKVRVNTKKLDRILKHVDGDMGKVVRSIGMVVVREAQVFAPVDLGALRAGIYMRSKENNALPAVPGDAERVDLPEPKTKTSVTVGPSVEYGIYQELGTSKMAAQPYLAPAVRKVEQGLNRFYDDMGKALGDG